TRSQHILGRAIDLQFPDVPLERLRNSALVREAGGVGYYPGSAGGFVHIDSGRVRYWPRISKTELAEIFAATGSAGDRGQRLHGGAQLSMSFQPVSKGLLHSEDFSMEGDAAALASIEPASSIHTPATQSDA